jgi:hypothetical protein
LKNTIFGVCLDSAHPETFLEQLGSWLELWHDKLGQIISKLPLETQDELVGRIT